MGDFLPYLPKVSVSPKFARSGLLKNLHVVTNRSKFFNFFDHLNYPLFENRETSLQYSEEPLNVLVKNGDVRRTMKIHSQKIEFEAALLLLGTNYASLKNNRYSRECNLKCSRLDL